MELPYDTLILVPRFHLKSALVKINIIQDILKDPNIRIALYSATSGLAETMLKDVKSTIRHPTLMTLFPEVVIPPGKKDIQWEKSTANMMTIRRDESEGSVPQECQVEAYGVGANIVGRHFDKHYYDDLVVPDYVSTQAQIDKLRDWYSYVQSILSPDGLEKMTGTRYHYSDLYNTVIEDKFYGKHVYVRQLETNGKFLYNYFDAKKLAKLRKRMSSYILSCQYYNNPIAKEDQLFPPPHPTFGVLPEGEYTYYIAVDPAATTKVYSDETAFSVGAFDRDKNMLYIVESFGVKKPGNEVAKIIIGLVDQYKPVKVGIEFALQEHLKYIIDTEVSKWEEVRKEKLPLYIASIPTTKQSKYDRIQWTLGAFVRGGQVQIKDNLHGLMVQMENLSPNYRGKDDLVDSASMLLLLIEGFGFYGNLKQEVPDWEPKNWFTIRELFKKKNVNTREGRFVK